MSSAAVDCLTRALAQGTYLSAHGRRSRGNSRDDNEGGKISKVFAVYLTERAKVLTIDAAVDFSAASLVV